MARPSKPVAVLKEEGRSHRTKAELELREKHEKAQLTGIKMKEPEAVKKDPAAHAMWVRTKKKLAVIGKDDALYEQSIARYCVLEGELAACAAEERRLDQMAAEAEKLREDGELDGKGYMEALRYVTDHKSELETLKMRKRKMQMDIERENAMTIAASLRAVPKTPEDDGAMDPMTAMLMQRMAARKG